MPACRVCGGYHQPGEDCPCDYNMGKRNTKERQALCSLEVEKEKMKMENRAREISYLEKAFDEIRAMFVEIQDLREVGKVVDTPPEVESVEDAMAFIEAHIEARPMIRAVNTMRDMEEYGIKIVDTDGGQAFAIPKNLDRSKLPEDLREMLEAAQRSGRGSK